MLPGSEKKTRVAQCVCEPPPVSWLWPIHSACGGYAHHAAIAHFEIMLRVDGSHVTLTRTGLHPYRRLAQMSPSARWGALPQPWWCTGSSGERCGAAIRRGLSLRGTPPMPTAHTLPPIVHFESPHRMSLHAEGGFADLSIDGSSSSAGCKPVTLHAQ